MINMYEGAFSHASETRYTLWTAVRLIACRNSSLSQLKNAYILLLNFKWRAWTSNDALISNDAPASQMTGDVIC